MSSLTTLVNETTQIKTDLISTRDTFKTKMTSKGFDTGSVNTISGLVNLTDGLFKTSYVAGLGSKSISDTNIYNVDRTSYKLLFTKNISDIKKTFSEFPIEGVRLSFLVDLYVNTRETYSVHYKYTLYRQNGSVINTSSGQLDYPGNKVETPDKNVFFNINIPSDAYKIEVHGYTTYSLLGNDIGGQIYNIKYECIGMVDNKYSLGKKWASGIAKPITSSRRFFNNQGAYDSYYYVEVQNIGFKPSCVVTFHNYDVQSEIQHNFTYYSINDTSKYVWCSLYERGKIYQCKKEVSETTAYVVDGGFLFPIYPTTTSINISWIAFE